MRTQYYYISKILFVTTLLIILQSKHGFAQEQKSEPLDINSKASELGISSDKLREILNSVEKGDGGSEGNYSPEAISDRFYTGEAAGDRFGYSVSSAGDVNGDGYDDVIVGAYANDAGGINAGRAYIYFGGPIFNGSANVVLTGFAATDGYGISVAGAGDVNGDGYDDVLIGAYFNDAGGTDAGRAYIYFGGQNMNNNPDVILTGEAVGDQFGASVSTAGDVNGDGYSDVIVGAPYNDAGGNMAGRAYIFYGGSSMNNIADVILTGESEDNWFGGSVSTAGDVNGDGYSDVIVGAYLHGSGGRAYIYYGGSSMNNTADVVFQGEASGNQFGRSVSTAGDVNGDGYSDVIVGAPLNSAGGSFAGRAYIYFGGSSMNNTADIVLTGNRLGALGNSVSGGRDINADGYDDVIVGAPNNNTIGSSSGRAFIYFGGEVMDNIVDKILTAKGVGDNFGMSVAIAGDVYGDGYCEVLVGAPLNDAGGADAGRAYLYRLTLAGTDLPDEFFTGAAAGDWFGYSVSSAGDVNGDDYNDIIVGAPQNDAGGNNAGRAYIYFGGPGMDNIADVILTGAAANDRFGASVSIAGDINGDGYDDVIVGAYGNDAGGIDAGRAYIYFGGSPMNNVADVVLTGAAAGDGFGSVSTAGDVNGDGYDDVIVGASSNDGGGTDAGRAYIFFGGSLMNNVADVILTGAASNDRFGGSVSTAGDVNGDGYDDVIVGATGTGRAYIYFGGQNMDNTADVILTGEAVSNYFGLPVSTAGDVNGDGYSDVIVGAQFNNAGGTEAGRAYIYFGGQNMNNTADVVLTGVAAGDRFGIVSAAGDVNGDGYDDVIVGAYGNDAGGINAGRAYIYFGGVTMDNTADIILTGEATGDLFGLSISLAGDINGDGYYDVIGGAQYNDAGGTDAGRAYLYLSTPPPINPRITTVRDLPNDQGGFVKLNWNRSGYDAEGQFRIFDYLVERSNPPGQSGFNWQLIASVPASRIPFYTYAAPTPSDSNMNSSGTYYFRVIARGTTPSMTWTSNIMYGHSIDNLAPDAPLNFYAASMGSSIKLGWQANTEPDLLNYLLFRSGDPSANPDTLSVFAAVTDTTYMDTNPLPNITYYFLKAQDVNYNLSPAVTASASASTTFALSVVVANGWNMVSIPGLHPVNQYVNTWWIDKNPAAGVFKYTTSGYQSVTEAIPGEGYWMNHVGNRVYSTGDEWPASGILIVPNTPLNGISGWNLIGGYHLPVSTSGITTTPPGLQQGSVFGYSSTSGYTIASNLVPGYSYWLRLSAAGQINIPNSLAKNPASETELVKEDWGRIIITDNQEKRYILYSVAGKAALEKFILPPAPPEGMFDIRYKSGRFAEDVSTLEQMIEMSGIEYPVTVRVEGITIIVQDETGKIVNTTLKTGEELIISDATVQKLKVKSEHIPLAYSLEQNYPNPFNPSTMIEFSIPEDVNNVKLTIYDALGQKVAELVNGKLEAGRYSYKWDAKNLASGLYIYHLQTNKFTSTKKMLMLK